MSKANRAALTLKHMKKSLDESKKMSDKEWHMQKHPELYPSQHEQTAEQIDKFMENLE